MAGSEPRLRSVGGKVEDSPVTAPVDPKRCPLCRDDNNCGAARGEATCWCFTARVPDEVLERVPPSARGVACVCEGCASGRRER